MLSLCLALILETWTLCSTRKCPNPALMSGEEAMGERCGSEKAAQEELQEISICFSL